MSKIPTASQVKAANQESEDWAREEVASHRAHMANKANWAEDSCTVCGHRSCIQGEEESCNWDGCRRCNDAAGAYYCLKGDHEWIYSRDYVQHYCLVCQMWHPDQEVID